MAVMSSSLILMPGSLTWLLCSLITGQLRWRTFSACSHLHAHNLHCLQELDTARRKLQEAAQAQQANAAALSKAESALPRARLDCTACQQAIQDAQQRLQSLGGSDKVMRWNAGPQVAAVLDCMMAAWWRSQ